MTATPTTKFLTHLSQFITFFFTLTLVHGFGRLAAVFEFSTQPSFNLFDPADVVLVASFGLTLFWIVTAWLGYSLLIERYPYTLNFGRFFFDVARFSLLFVLFNFSFLVNTFSYYAFIFTLAVFHGMMAGWHISHIRLAAVPNEQAERRNDARDHGLRCLTYLTFGLVFYFGVTLRPEAAFAGIIHYGIVLTTFAAMIIWSLKRLAALKAYAVREVPDHSASSADAAAQAPVTSVGAVPSKRP